MCKICSKLTIKSPERRNWGRSCIFIINFEQISHIVLAFPLLTLKKLMQTSRYFSSRQSLFLDTRSYLNAWLSTLLYVFSMNFSNGSYFPQGNSTEQKMKFCIKDFYSKCDQIHRKLRIWSHLLKKSLMKNFIFVQCSNRFCSDRFNPFQVNVPFLYYLKTSET